MKTSAANCPDNVRKQIQSADLTTSESSTLFAWIAENSPLECQVHAVGVVAERLGADSDPQVIDDFCGAAATYAKFLAPEDRIKVKDAYTRFLYRDSIALNYFGGLRRNQIDIRAQLTGKVEEDWTFDNPRRDAATWHYYLYLASLDTPGAYEALRKKLTDTANGNDLTNLIKSLAELRTPRTKDILLEYRDDMRTADSPVGPGMTVSETVKILLETYFN